jgi:hypothetical protein
MKAETKILVSLLFLPPAMGELLSGSSPPLQFFNPLMLFMLVLLYGCGTLLIRELMVRWNMQWSVIFLAVAYGIIEEGLMVKSYFNPGWVDMGVLSGYGMYFGVQWTWTIMLTFYHATISTLIPITLVGMYWPEYARVPLLKKRGLRLASAGLIFITLQGMIFMGTWENGKMIPFYPRPFLLIGSTVVVTILALLAFRYRDSRITTHRFLVLPPLVFGIMGFMFQLLNLILPNVLAEIGTQGIVTIAIQLVFFTSALLFGANQVYHRDVTKWHITALVSGSLSFFILFAALQEFNPGTNPDPTQGMLLVGVVSLVLLSLWRRTVLKNETG